MSLNLASPLERYMLKLLNTERTERGLDPLQLEQHLNQSAEKHSEWMLATDTFSHAGRGGSAHDDRIEAAGFDMSGTWLTGENIALRSIGGAPGFYDEVRLMMQGLMDSPGHKANILKPAYDYVGIGIELGKYTAGGHAYTALAVTQNFGATSKSVLLDGAASGGSGSSDRGRSITGNDKGNALAGTGRDDAIWGRDGADSLIGRDGDDALRGGAGNDFLRGGRGDDTAWGSSGNDRFAGENGQDRLMGGTGNDYMLGGNGQDILQGGTGADTVFAGRHDDRVWGNDQRDRLFGGTGDDAIWGGRDHDKLWGGKGHDLLGGDTGNDAISGGNGDDVIRGGKGRDRIDGGYGDDTMTGGAWCDSFVFRKGNGADTITDFQRGADRLLLDDAIWGGGLARWEVVADHARLTDAGLALEFGHGHNILLEDVQTAWGMAANIEIF
ncbi:CAP domain-containing protein [Roseisalinus antarcticus]|uniref:Hemolysin, chromosomal n=1 Tax=Roseisalinus antarcticus TaxID=254357 RepID=A0A1Y5TPS6_9RHOB|nr:CAP domain-containing protein [Roseisalinus antarcticus]SLN69281.1 Hemolysin, chromosomal [Roseisalinus antarcticus]